MWRRVLRIARPVAFVKAHDPSGRATKITILAPGTCSAQPSGETPKGDHPHG